MSKMNRRSFLRGAATAAAVVAVPIAAVGQQERFLVNNLGLPASAEPHVEIDPPYYTQYDWASRMSAGMRDMQQVMMLLGAYAVAKEAI